MNRLGLSELTDVMDDFWSSMSLLRICCFWVKGLWWLCHMVLFKCFGHDFVKAWFGMLLMLVLYFCWKVRGKRVLATALGWTVWVVKGYLLPRLCLIDFVWLMFGWSRVISSPDCLGGWGLSPSQTEHGKTSGWLRVISFPHWNIVEVNVGVIHAPRRTNATDMVKYSVPLVVKPFRGLVSRTG